MNSVSFKSLYVIPHNEVQNPSVKDYTDFITETASLRDTNKKPEYDKKNDTYSIYIRDENDLKFEEYAAWYGINYKKINFADINAASASSKKESPAEKSLKVLARAISLGAKHKIGISQKRPTITLYDDKGDKIFAKYIFKAENKEQLAKKIEYLNGKPDCIFDFDENGNIKKTVIKTGKKGVEITPDNDGKNPTVQEVKDTYAFLYKVCKANNFSTDFIPEYVKS